MGPSFGRVKYLPMSMVISCGIEMFRTMDIKKMSGRIGKSTESKAFGMSYAVDSPKREKCVYLVKHHITIDCCSRTRKSRGLNAPWRM
jgi:hypothetical protein